MRMLSCVSECLLLMTVMGLGSDVWGFADGVSLAYKESGNVS